jgi:hypothetical protein
VSPARKPAPIDSAPPRGLPDHLPDGETLVWQGAPSFRALAMTAFHWRKIMVYFLLLLTWRLATALGEGHSLVAALVDAAPLILLFGIGLAVVAALAWLSARTTVYTITNKRVVMRCGIALPVSFNIPFKSITAVDLKGGAAGTGDLALTLPAGNRIAYLHLWPHARPWHVKRPQPALRCIPGAAKVGQILAQALVTANGGQRVALADAPTRRANLPRGIGVAAE